jgi:hypothetical protein
MADNFGIGYIVLDRKSLCARGFEDWTPSSRWVKRPIGGDIYDVYYRRDSAEEDGRSSIVAG